MTLYPADLANQQPIVGTHDELVAAFSAPATHAGLAYIPRDRQLIIETDTGTQYIGDGVTSFAGLTPLPAAGGMQIATQSTDTTPSTDVGGGGPGLFAASSGAVEDGGFVTIDIEQDHTQLVLGTGEKTGGVGIVVWDLGESGQQANVSGNAVGPTHTALAQLTTDAESFTTAQLRVATFVNGVDDGTDSFQVVADSSNGVYVTISALVDQTHEMLTFLRPDGSTIFSVDPLGPILWSPNGTGYRLKVANDGTLSTEAV